MMAIVYRASTRRCAACGEPMDEVTVTLADGDEAAVDLCSRCGCVFVEFFDGEPVAVARRLSAHLSRQQWATDLPEGVLECPDCHRELVPRRYLEDGPLLLRCESCLAAFATPAQLARLAGHHSYETEGSWLSKLLRFLGGG